MALKLTMCPVCGFSIDKIQDDWVGKFKDEKYIVPDLEFYRCSNCGEEVYSRDAMQKIESCSPAFRASNSIEQ